jgi:uncharacterized protein (TIGR00297 family)
VTIRGERSRRASVINLKAHLFDLLTLVEISLGIILIISLAVLAIKLKAIDPSGAVSGAVISLATFMAGGFSWFVMMVIFVAISSALTRYKYEYKRKLGYAQEKMGIRSWPNSVANGGVSVIAALAELVIHSEVFAVMFLASVAAAMSDTVATELGLLSPSTPRLITHPTKFVEPGTSGGVSWLGTIAAILSALGMSLIGAGLFVIRGASSYLLLVAVLSVIAGSLSGVFFDSFLGATVQSVNRCEVCDKLTENATHHERPTNHVRGLRSFDNNFVNFFGILFGSIVSIAIYLLLASH